MRIAFAGVFAGHVAERVRVRVQIPCDVVQGGERDILSRLGDVDVLVSMAFTPEMAAAAPRLRLVQVPGAGLDRIDRAALGPATALANAYGHDIGIAEYVLGAMLALARDFRRIDASLREGRWESVWSGAPVPLWPELAGKTLGIVGYGRIGQAVARRALAFDMEVLAIRRDARQPDPNRLVSVRFMRPRAPASMRPRVSGESASVRARKSARRSTSGIATRRARAARRCRPGGRSIPCRTCS